MKCPVCKGKGELEPPITPKTKQDAIKLLHEHGFGVRQTQRLLGYKSPRSVSKILETYNK